MKNILHFQIPLGNRGIKDDLSIRPEILGGFMKIAQKVLGNEYYVVASPFIPSLLSDESVLYNFDMAQITLAELKKILEDNTKD